MEKLINTLIKGFVLIGLWFSSFALQADPEGRWVATQEHNGIAYFISSAPAEIARYNLVNGTFLSSLPLTKVPTNFHIDSDGIFVAFDREIGRLDHDGSNFVSLTSAIGSIQDLTSVGQYLYASVNTSPNYLVVNKTDEGDQFTEDTFTTMTGMLGINNPAFLLGRSINYSPSDIIKIPVNTDGTFSFESDSPYHGDYPSASELYLTPDETVTIDSSGIAYYVSDLTYAGSLSGNAEDIAFHDSDILVLRDDLIRRYNSDFLSIGELNVSADIHTIYNSGNDIVGFGNDSSGSLVDTKYAVNSIVPPLPGEEVDPAGLVFTPDEIVDAVDGTLLLLSKVHKSIFRWSPTLNSYTQSIPLVNEPKYMAYSAMNDVIYLAYETGAITQVDTATGQESAFANLPSQALGLAVADPYVFAVDPAGAWVSHFTFSPAGELISQVEWNYFSTEFVWSAANRKMYFFRDDTSPNDLHSEEIDVNGVLGAMNETPYHSSDGIRHPIRVSPGGLYVLLGSGRIYNASTLELVNSISNDVIDAQWISDSSIVSIQQKDTMTFALQTWNSNFTLQSSIDVSTNSVELASSASGTYLIWDKNGVPQIIRWNLGTDDLDGDGVSDDLDVFPLDPEEWEDTDMDGVGDNADEDDDSDGILDVDDTYPKDTDNDGIDNALDDDDDNDGVVDADDQFPFDASESTDNDMDGVGDNSDADDDNDGYLDTNDAFPFDPTEWLDSDGDGIGDNSDFDRDNDGVDDYEDYFPDDPTEWEDTDFDGIGNNADPDDDNDGISDANDTYPFDTDNDGVENVDDEDDDGDGVVDYQDLFPLDASESQDHDYDGIGDNADSDDDNDGVSDENDAFPLDYYEQQDTDNDGIGNNSDADDDGDGMPDEWEEHYGFNTIDASDANADPDNDGLTNLKEYQDGTNPTVSDAPTPPVPAPAPASGGGGGSTGLVTLCLLGLLCFRKRYKFIIKG